MARMLPLDRAGDKHRASSQGGLGNSYHPEHRRHFHSLDLHQLAPIRSIDDEPFRDLYAASGYSIGFPRPPQSDPRGDPSKISYHLHHFPSAADRHSDRSLIPTSVEFLEKSESDHCRFFLTYQPGSHNRHAPQRGGWTRGVLDLWFGAALRNSRRSPGSRFVDDDFTPHAADNGLNLGIFISLCQFIPLCCELRLAGRPNQWDHNQYGRSLRRYIEGNRHRPIRRRPYKKAILCRYSQGKENSERQHPVITKERNRTVHLPIGWCSTPGPGGLTRRPSLL